MALPESAQRDHKGHHQWLADEVVRQVMEADDEDLGSVNFAPQNMRSQNFANNTGAAQIFGDQRPHTFVLIITEHDLWSGELNYAFGVNNVKQHVGIMSLSRFQPATSSPDGELLLLRRALKTAAFLTGQDCGIRDYAGYKCCMNRTNNLPDLDKSPLAFCPECERKAWWLADSDPLQRYEGLKSFAAAHNLREEQNSWEAAITAIRTGSERP